MNSILKTKNKKSNHTRQLVLTGLIFALALVLSMVENALPVPVPVPGVKLGLSNIAVMYALFFLGRNRAIMIAVLKASFIFMMRGGMAGLLSLSGGLVSLAVMMLLMLLFKDRISYLILSVFGAVFHNLGQFTVVSYIYTDMFLWGYLPVLLISGVAAGVVTSVILRGILPAFKRLA
jgi:heptaprenyl diphosphate synthase